MELMELKNDAFMTQIKREGLEDKVIPISKILLSDHQVRCGIDEGSKIG